MCLNCLKLIINRKSSSHWKNTHYIEKNKCHEDDSRLFTKNNARQKYFKVPKEKNCDPTFLYPVKVSFKNECEIKITSHIKKLRELITRSPVL